MRRTAVSFAFFLVLTLFASAAQITNSIKQTGVGSGGNVIVRVGNGDILISANAANQTVQVEAIGIDQKQLANFSVREDSGNVYVDYKPQGGWGSDVTFRISVPDLINLDLNTAGGDITFEGDIQGRAQVRTSGGDISMSSMSGEVDVKTAGGDISGGAMRGQVRIQTSGGDIQLETSEGPTELATSGGDIQVGDVGDQLTASTSGGDIEIGSVRGSASVKTAGGDIEVGQVEGEASLSTAGGDIELAGADGPVRATTAGGDLVLREIQSGVVAATSGGDIVAHFSGTGGDPSELKSAGGSIKLAVPSPQSVRIEATIKLSSWQTDRSKISIWENGAEAPNLIRDAAANELRATMGTGSYLIRVSTSNGDIRVSYGGLQ